MPAAPFQRGWGIESCDGWQGLPACAVTAVDGETEVVVPAVVGGAASEVDGAVVDAPLVVVASALECRPLVHPAGPASRRVMRAPAPTG